MENKQCTKCGAQKPLTEYHKSRRAKGGHSSCCRECTAVRHRAYRDTPAGQLRQAAWRKANPEKIREIAARSYRRNSAKVAKACRAYKQAHPNMKYASELKLKYGITLTEYEQMLAKQGGVCAICRTYPANARSKRLSVDHDHVSGKVRGLLCDKHNRAIGLFGDDPEMLMKAILYLVENAAPFGRLWLPIAA